MGRGAKLGEEGAKDAVKKLNGKESLGDTNIVIKKSDMVTKTRQINIDSGVRKKDWQRGAVLIRLCCNKSKRKQV